MKIVYYKTLALYSIILTCKKYHTKHLNNNFDKALKFSLNFNLLPHLIFALYCMIYHFKIALGWWTPAQKPKCELYILHLI